MLLTDGAAVSRMTEYLSYKSLLVIPNPSTLMMICEARDPCHGITRYDTHQPCFVSNRAHRRVRFRIQSQLFHKYEAARSHNASVLQPTEVDAGGLIARIPFQRMCAGSGLLIQERDNRSPEQIVDADPACSSLDTRNRMSG